MNEKAEAAWAVRGIPTDLRCAIAERAHREGKTIGGWVAEVLRRALEQDDVPTQIAKLVERVERLERLAGRENIPVTPKS